MTQIAIRRATEADFARIVALNEAEVEKTSPMDRERLRELDRLSSYHKVAVADGQVVAFLLAMRESAPYVNDNFDWFSARLARFFYVDRIIVASAFFGRRIGTWLYQDLFAFARMQGVETVACEYNIEPPNHASQCFHQRFGFRELGRQWVADGSKQVSLRVCEIQPCQ